MQNDIHHFRTTAGVIAGIIVATKAEAVDYCFKHAKPVAFWDAALQCWRVFRHKSSIKDEQTLDDYSVSASLVRPRPAFLVMRRMMGGA